MNTNGFKIGDIVSISPFGESPIHYCKIESFDCPNDLAKGTCCFAMGNGTQRKPIVSVAPGLT